MLIFEASSRTLQWVATERVELYGAKIDEDLLSKIKRNSPSYFSWFDFLIKKLSYHACHYKKNNH